MQGLCYKGLANFPNFPIIYFQNFDHCEHNLPKQIVHILSLLSGQIPHRFAYCLVTKRLDSWAGCLYRTTKLTLHLVDLIAVSGLSYLRIVISYRCSCYHRDNAILARFISLLFVIDCISSKREQNNNGSCLH